MQLPRSDHPDAASKDVLAELPGPGSKYQHSDEDNAGGDGRAFEIRHLVRPGGERSAVTL